MPSSHVAFIWTHATLPPPPWKLFIIEADYRVAAHHPHYEVCAQSLGDAKKWFRRTFTWLKILDAYEAPFDWKPAYPVKSSTGNIYITGDKHGDYASVSEFCFQFQTTKEDLLIVLGDNGINYFGESAMIKKQLESLPITFMMIRGNHDMRPSEDLGYHIKFIKTDTYSGMFLVQDDYPSLLFACDGGFYTLKDKEAFVIGGAYSPDKDWRLKMQQEGYLQYRWFADEQLSKEERSTIRSTLDDACRHQKTIDYFLTHTCPYKYKPVDMLSPNFNQAEIDETMELWLDEIENSVPCQKWYCGHWHIDRVINKMCFMYHAIIPLD